MTVAKKTIKDLIAGSGKRPEVMGSVPIKIRAKLKADLIEVLKTKDAGKPVPGALTIAKFFEEQYNYRVDDSTIRGWLIRIKEELNGK